MFANLSKNKLLVISIGLFILTIASCTYVSISHWYLQMYSKKEVEKLNHVTNYVLSNLMNDIEKGLSLLHSIKNKFNNVQLNLDNKFIDLDITKNWQPKIIRNPSITIKRTTSEADTTRENKKIFEISEAINGQTKVLFRFDLASTLEAINLIAKNEAICFIVKVKDHPEVIITNLEQGAYYTKPSHISNEQEKNNVYLKAWVNNSYLNQKHAEQIHFALIITLIITGVMILLATFSVWFMRSFEFKDILSRKRQAEKIVDDLTTHNKYVQKQKEIWIKSMSIKNSINSLVIADFNSLLNNLVLELHKSIKLIKKHYLLDTEANQQLIRYMDYVEQHGVDYAGLLYVKSSNQLRCVNLWPIVRSAVDYFGYEILNKQLKVVLMGNEHQEVNIEFFDKTLFTRMLFGIIGISIKCLPKNKSLSVEVKQEPNEVILEFCDDGYGFSIDDMDKMLQSPLEDELILNPQLIKYMLRIMEVETIREVSFKGTNKIIFKIPVKGKEQGYKIGANVITLHSKNK